MSSQSSTTTTLARRSAAALGTSAVLCLGLAGPALAMKLPDPIPVPQASSAPSDCVYVGGASTVSCRDQSSASPGSGAGSASAAEQGTPEVATPVSPRVVLPSPEPSDLPAIGIGVAAAVVIAGGLMIASTNRRRAA